MPADEKASFVYSLTTKSKVLNCPVKQPSLLMLPQVRENKEGVLSCLNRFKLPCSLYS